MTSAVVISINDNSHIQKCIQQLDFVDQIVIVGTLNETTQRQLESSEKKITYIHNHSDMPKSLLKTGSERCTGDWILGLEADILLSKDLKAKLVSQIQNKTKKSVYCIKLQLDFMGKLIAFSGYQNRWIPILWPNETPSHPQQKLKEKGLKSYSSFDEFNQRITALCKREAFYLHKKNHRPNWFHLIWNPFWSLQKNFILNLGFLDGKEGFALAYIQAFARVKTQLFLWLNYRTIE